ncbi:MAG: hypothetical protein ABFS32_20725 [Bacteroidota bacterium]
MSDLIFWSRTGRRIELDYHRMIQALQGKGIYRYFLEGNEYAEKPIFVQVNENKVKQVDDGYMLNLLNEVIDDHGDATVRELFMSARNKLSFERLSLLPSLKQEFLTDDRDRSYFFFRKSVGIVYDDKIEIVPYSKVDGLIWESQIINHDLEASLQRYQNTQSAPKKTSV